jgi:RNA polymerase sigma-54 factor
MPRQPRRTVITGTGTVTPFGLGTDALWEGLCAGTTLVAPCRSFDFGGFPTPFVAQVPEGGFDVKNVVPKSYRKATKVMSRDIELAVGAAFEAVREAGMLIASLNPKPGRAFSGEEAQVLSPDVVIEKIGEDFVVSLVRESVPQLRISRTYRDLLGEAAGVAEVRSYLRDKIRGGKFLIRSIQQRQQTILAITREIAVRQRRFLEEGVAALAPMTMAQVAGAVGVHETTVSRAMAGKSVATPLGIFELKFFFTSGYRAADGAEVSSTSVKDAIAALIRSEDLHKPWSDQHLADQLKADGLAVARRTVAKYREVLGILPSNLRKSF